MGGSLVSWRPVIGQRLGKQIAATVRRGGVAWESTRQRGRRIPELRSVGDSAPDVVHYVCSINMTAVVPGSSASNTCASSAE
ncbi:TPA: DUF3363 domain-containing protein [Burkholderia lata]|uniref:DUF3363 domain-containing protein n=1 Tax=Burkholderia aenigmatica TaxID=2015348 RepID=UPI003C6C32A7